MHAPAAEDNFPNNDRLRFPFRVSAIGDGYIEFDQPLPIDIRMLWQARGAAWLLAC